MKKMIFGIMVFTAGLVYSVFCFIYAAMNPWNYNGIQGLLGSFLGTHLLIPFLIAMTVAITGLGICGYEAYGRDIHNKKTEENGRNEK